MKNINQRTVFFMEKNTRGAWVVYGTEGVKQYYGYTQIIIEERNKQNDSQRMQENDTI